jgi:hypothetical protein
MVKQLGCRLTAGLMLVGLAGSCWAFDINTEYRGHIYRPEIPIRYMLDAGNYFAVTFDLNVGEPVAGQPGEYGVQSAIKVVPVFGGAASPEVQYPAAGTIKFFSSSPPNISPMDVKIVGLELASQGSTLISLDGSVGETHFPPDGSLFDSFFDILTRWSFGVEYPIILNSEGSTRFQLAGIAPPGVNVPDSGSSAMLVLLPMGLAWVCQRRQGQLARQA